MVFKIKEEVTNQPSQVNLIDDDFSMILELSLFAFNIKREVCDVLKSLKKKKKRFEERKVHNMLSLMLNLRFKSFYLISSFIGHGEGVSTIEEYNKQSLYPMFLKCYQHLHLMT
jgi:hypothetical protein